LPPTSTLFPYTTLFRSTDNLFKFKEYISYNTYGNQSITTDIRVELAKPLEQFELTQELSAKDYLKISPTTEGKLVVENGKTLILDRKSTRLNSSHVKIS